MNEKWILLSKTIHGNIINIISIITILFLEHHINPEIKVLFVSAILSNIYSIYGRIVAKEKLKFKRNKKEK